MSRIEQIDNQLAMINSPDSLRRLRGYQGLMALPQVYRQEGGLAEVAEAPIEMPEAPVEMPEDMVREGAEAGVMQAQEIMEQVPPEMQEEYQAQIAELKEAARGLASMGRMGDTELVHMNPEELEGLHSMGTLTYNPVTGLPEAFSIGKIFKSIASIPKKIAKGIKSVAKSKAFKVLAPIVLGVAAPYVLGAGGLGLFSTTSALGFGAATALGTGLGSLLAGQKPGDALKSGLISGLTAGVMKGVSTGNWTGAAPAQLPSESLKPLPGHPGPKGVFKVADQGFGKTIGAGAGGGGAPAIYPSTNIQPVVQGVGTTPSAATTVQQQGLYEAQQAAKGITSPATIVEKPSIWENLTSKDMWKNVAGEMKEDFIIPKEGSKGIDLLASGKAIGQAALPTQVGEMVADASAAQDAQMLSQEEFENSLKGAAYRERFPTYQAYQAAFKYQAPVMTTEQQAIDTFVGSPPMLAKEGGIIDKAGGGYFSGLVPGQGHGMEDNVYMPIVQRERGRQVGTLAVSPKEYVVDAYTMSALGNGNPDAGAKVMDRAVKEIRKDAYGTTKQPNEIDGLRTLVPPLTMGA